jgi:hypothetical protein
MFKNTEALADVANAEATLAAHIDSSPVEDEKRPRFCGYWHVSIRIFTELT